MARRVSGFYFDNMTPSLKKIEDDILAIQSSIGGAHAELVNLTQRIIQREGFVDSPDKSEFYKDLPGGNRRNKNGVVAFHDKKIVDRGADLRQIFQTFNFSKGPKLSSILYFAKNKGIEVKIHKERGHIVADYTFLGKYDKIFGVFEAGRKKNPITTVKNGKARTQRRGQRKIVSSGFTKSLARWEKINKFYLERGLDRRNKVKF